MTPEQHRHQGGQQDDEQEEPHQDNHSRVDRGRLSQTAVRLCAPLETGFGPSRGGGRTAGPDRPEPVDVDPPAQADAALLARSAIARTSPGDAPCAGGADPNPGDEPTSRRHAHALPVSRMRQHQSDACVAAITAYTRRCRRFFRSTACGSVEPPGIESERTI
jgi:hypothetical protein